MLTTNTPPIVPSEYQTPSAIIEQLKAHDGAAAFGNDSSDFIKKLILGYLVKRSIRQNEAQHVATGVQIMDLQSEQPILSHNIDTQHFAASINKVPVALLVLKDLRASALDLDQMMTWQASDVRGGFGLYDQPGAPLQAPLRDVLFDMLNRSGNTAVRVLVNQGLGGAAAVNEKWMHIPQLTNTRLQPLDGNRFYLGNTTAQDSLWAITELTRNGNEAYTQFMKNALATNIFTDFGTRSQLAGNDYIVLVNKIGLLDDPEGNNRHDAGIIYNKRTHKSYAYSFMTTSPYEDADATARADESLKEMGRYTLRFSGDRQTLLKQQTVAPLAAPQAEKRILY